MKSPPPADAPFNPDQAKRHQQAWADYLNTKVETDGPLGIKLILIPPGTFTMGATQAEIDEIINAIKPEELEKNANYIAELKSSVPQHKVKLTKPYRMASTEVTVGQFRKFIAATNYKTDAERDGKGGTYYPGGKATQLPEIIWSNPGHTQTDEHPVVQISWNDAAAFCNWLSREAKLSQVYVDNNDRNWRIVPGPGYRLPTEAEWEHTCRAGTTTRYFSGDDPKSINDYAWHSANSGGRAHPVASKLTNPFGLFDIQGNARELCQDWNDDKYFANAKGLSVDPLGARVGSLRVIRGGNWSYGLSSCRSEFRNRNTPSYRNNHNGFRVCCDAVPAGDTPSSVPNPKSEITNPKSKIAVQGDQPALAKAPFSATEGKAHQAAWAEHLGTEVVVPNSLQMPMVLIPPGEFQMGSTDEEVAAALAMIEDNKPPNPKDYENWVAQVKLESPAHRVRLTKPFRLCKDEVTIGQFRKFIEQSGYKTQAEQFGFGNSHLEKPDDTVKQEQMQMTWQTPSYEVSDDTPVTQVSWNDCVAFCNWLSGEEKLEPSYRQDGKTWVLIADAAGYRLPTEAEWEYACRAGTTSHYWFGDDAAQINRFAWTNKNDGGRARAIGQWPANPFGLRDMHGNVWEWCHDGYVSKWYATSPVDNPVGPFGPSSRVLRGGSWNGPPLLGRSAYRLNYLPTARSNSRGFRPALSSVGAKP